MTKLEAVDLAVEYVSRYVGHWYKWGGDDPSGFDCSGLAIEMLKSVGIVPRRYDTTASGLWEEFEDYRRVYAEKGFLVFFGEEQPTHVEICINRSLALGASGGGSKTLSEMNAIRDNAFIKVRPIGSRGDLLGFVDPFERKFPR